MEKKKRDFAWLIGLNLFMFILSNVFSRQEYPFPFPPKSVVFPTIITVLTVTNYFLFRVTSNFISSRWFRFGYASILLSQFILTGYSVRNGVLISDSIIPGSIAFTMQLITNATVLYVIIDDMFKNKHDVNYSLLAATNAYLFFPIFFGYIYSLLCLHSPALLQLEGAYAQRMISMCFEVSQLMAVGFDIPAYVSPLIKSIGILEATIMNLYIIFVVGKLLTNTQK